MNNDSPRDSGSRRIAILVVGALMGAIAVGCLIMEIVSALDALRISSKLMTDLFFVFARSTIEYIIILFCIGLYFAPTLVAVLGRSPHVWPIIIVNILFGWTIVGWIVAAGLASYSLFYKNIPTSGALAHVSETTASVPSAENELTRRYEAMKAWGAVGSAISGTAAFVALGLGLWQFFLAQDRWQKDVAIKAGFEGNQDRPYISEHCIGAMYTLDDTQVDDLHARREVMLKPDQTECVRRCFADLGGREERAMYMGDAEISSDGKRVRKLSPRGSALLAQRVNYSLDKDELVASLLLAGIGNTSFLYDLYGPRICLRDKHLVERIIKVGQHWDVDSFNSLFKPILDFSQTRFCEKEATPWRPSCTK